MDSSSERQEHRKEQKDLKAELDCRTKELKQALSELETSKDKNEEEVKNLNNLDKVPLKDFSINNLQGGS